MTEITKNRGEKEKEEVVIITFLLRRCSARSSPCSRPRSKRSSSSTNTLQVGSFDLLFSTFLNLRDCQNENEISASGETFNQYQKSSVSAQAKSGLCGDKDDVSLQTHYENMFVMLSDYKY